MSERACYIIDFHAFSLRTYKLHRNGAPGLRDMELTRKADFWQPDYCMHWTKALESSPF
jgi:hypothetical protein